MEFILSDDEILDRVVLDCGFICFEFSVFIVYGKMVLKDELNIFDIMDNLYYGCLFISVFFEVFR